MKPNDGPSKANFEFINHANLDPEASGYKGYRNLEE